jgi:hypothetical protein
MEGILLSNRYHSNKMEGTDWIGPVAILLHPIFSGKYRVPSSILIEALQKIFSTYSREVFDAFQRRKKLIFVVNLVDVNDIALGIILAFVFVATKTTAEMLPSALWQVNKRIRSRYYYCTLTSLDSIESLHQ